MSIWAIVPVKPLNRAKSRLAPILSPEEREDLSKTLLENSLKTLLQVNEINGILVISRDTGVLSLARQLGVQTIQETGTPELIASLSRATQVVNTWKASGVLTIAADIPFMQPSDIKEMIALAKQSTSPATVVIAPDRRKDGTNAMLMIPPGLFDYQYGEGSFEKHIQSARAHDAEVLIYDSPTIALDIDIPEDLKQYQDIVSRNGQGIQLWLEELAKTD